MPEGVFCILYCNQCSKTNEPLVLMHMREDGRLGFAGGTVDEGEDHITALKREILEEYGYTVPETSKPQHYKSDVSPSGWYLHHYTLELEDTGIHSIMRNQFEARDWLLETRGLVLIPLKARAIFLKNQFAGNAAEVLDLFLNQLEVK